MKDSLAYCGLDCEKCDAYLATVNNDGELRKKTAALWSELNGVTISPEMINCAGCRADGVKTPYCDAMCEIRKCAVKKNVRTCADCAVMNDCKPLGDVLGNSPDAKNNLSTEK